MIAVPFAGSVFGPEGPQPAAITRTHPEGPAPHRLDLVNMRIPLLDRVSHLILRARSCRSRILVWKLPQLSLALLEEGA